MTAWFFPIVAIGACLTLAACPHKPVRSQAPSAPPVVAAKPKPRPLREGDFVLKGKPETLPNGTIICHQAIQTIDSTKVKESVTVYTCR